MQGLYLRENKSLVREGQESNIIYFTVMHISGIIFHVVQGLARRKKNNHGKQKRGEMVRSCVEENFQKNQLGREVKFWPRVQT